MVARRNQGEAPDSYFLWFGFGLRELNSAHSYAEETLKMQENPGLFPRVKVMGTGGKFGAQQ